MTRYLRSTERWHGRPPQAYTATVTSDKRGTVTEWGDGAGLLLGYRPEETLGRQAAEVLGTEPTDAARHALDERTRWSGTASLRHRDGRLLDVWLLAHRLENGSGGTEWLLASAPGFAHGPVPDRERTMTEWGFVQAPCTVALFDTDLRAVRANADMERVAALTEYRMRGLRLPDIVTDPSSERVEQAMREVLATGKQRQVETYVQVPGENREHAWSVALSPLRDQAGTVHGVCLAAHDRTEYYAARQRLLLVNEAGSRIGSTLDITRTAEELVDVAMPRLADYAAVDLLTFIHEGDEPPAAPLTGPITMRRAAMRYVVSGPPDDVLKPGTTTTFPQSSPAAECLNSGRPAVYEMSDETLAAWAVHDPERAARIRHYGAHSVMVVPMRARGVTLGVALFARNERPVPFAPDDVLLAEEITARAAVCIDNARRYARERRTSMALQRSLLPQELPDQPAMELAYRYRPAGGRAGVGGDWFDAIPLSGTRVALVVGDVVGHGVHASGTMGRLRSSVRTLADIDLPPDELITHLDDVVIRLGTEGSVAHPDAAGDLGATCLYAVYDPVTRQFCLASAGHPLPALVLPDGSAKFLDVPAGPPLGVGNLPFETTDVELPEGSLLALYTDGLLEARGQDADASRETLLRILARPGESLDALCDAVLGALLPERPDDDSVLLLARTRCLSDSKVATWSVPYEPAAVAAARTHATDQLAAWGLDEFAFTAELVVSELVTNAIRYGRPPIQLRLIHDRALICEVSDASYTSPHLRRARVFDEGGRGLLLVAQLTERWGTRYTQSGKTIWGDVSLAES
ncbi:SpoIIE family protein phosphatase [Streptomyces sp. NPDC051018]|uniref:SpoIIE family protein phosphatase n=1 Tax=Streptomyces sp. NPDC051018 TaxID=3365639 RepID=UPI00379CCD7E